MDFYCLRLNANIFYLLYLNFTELIFVILKSNDDEK